MIWEEGIYTGGSHVCKFCTHKSKYVAEARISLELNMDDNKLYFFINEELFPYYVSNIPSGVYFGVFISYYSFLIYLFIIIYLFIYW
jgi:hypothetical protein